MQVLLESTRAQPAIGACRPPEAGGRLVGCNAVAPLTCPHGAERALQCQWVLSHNSDIDVFGVAVKSRRKNSSVKKGERAPKELEVKASHDQIIFREPKRGFDFVLDQAEVAGAVYFEASKTLEIALHRGSQIRLECTFDDSRYLAIRLFPEERDGEFMYQPLQGARYCAWEDLQ